LVDESKKRYDEKLKDLIGKKQQLFKKGDVKLWKCNEDDMTEALNAKGNFVQAQKYILPKVT
jgi:hypothetical protein